MKVGDPISNKLIGETITVSPRSHYGRRVITEHGDKFRIEDIKFNHAKIHCMCHIELSSSPACFAWINLTGDINFVVEDDMSRKKKRVNKEKFGLNGTNATLKWMLTRALKRDKLYRMYIIVLLYKMAELWDDPVDIIFADLQWTVANDPDCVADAFAQFKKAFSNEIIDGEEMTVGELTEDAPEDVEIICEEV